MKRLILILPLLFVCFSCTVTKRVHRPGFHVQWRSFQRTDADPVSTQQKSVASAPTVEDQFLVKEVALIDRIQRKWIGESVDFDFAQSPDSGSTNSAYNAQWVDFDSAQSPDSNSTSSAYSAQSPGSGSKRSAHGVQSPDANSATERSRSQAEEQNTKVFTTRPILWRLSPSTLKKLGIVFICIGIFLLLGSMMVAVGAFSVNDSGNGAAWFNFFLDLISISGWFWILAFILLLIFALYLSFLFVKYVMGGALLGLIVGASFLILGIFFYALGKSREVEP